LLCVTAFTLQACGGGGTGPTPAKLANPANTAAQLQSLSAPTATGTFQSFAVLIAHFAAAGSGGLVTAASPVAAPGRALAWGATAEYDRLRRPHRPDYPQRGRARRRHRWDDGADPDDVRQLHHQSPGRPERRRVRRGLRERRRDAARSHLDADRDAHGARCADD